MLKVGQTQRVEITGYSSEGLGVCRIDGCAVFVPNAIRGEVCLVKVTHVSKNSAHGKIEQILERSPERIARACPAAKLCGGCQLHHMSYAEELRYKSQKVYDALTRLGGLQSLPQNHPQSLPQSHPPGETQQSGGQLRVSSPLLRRSRSNWHPQALVSPQATDEGTSDELPLPITGADELPLPITGADEIRGYRNKAQYPVAMQNGRPVAGFYKNRTHEVIPVERCAILPEVFDRVRDTVIRWAEEDRISVYDEGTGQGLLRHIYVRRGAVSGQVMVCLVVNGDRLPRENRLIHALQREIPGLASVILSENRKNTNVVLGERFRTLWGADHIEDELCGFTFRLSPRSFYQVNHDQAERLYEKALELADLHGTETVLDLYCGTGTITLALSRKAGRAVGVEVVPQAIADAKENAARNGVTNVEFLCADAGEAAQRFCEEASAGADAQSLPPGGTQQSGGLLRVSSPLLRRSRSNWHPQALVPPQGADEGTVDARTGPQPSDSKERTVDRENGFYASPGMTGRPDVIVVDPPRKGLAPEVIDAMVRMAPERIVYVSCDPATLARDVKRLTEQGYALSRAEAFDLFPRTFHVETVCLLSKLRSEQHVEIDLDLSELDLTAAESAATYEEIKGFVQENFGFQVSSLQIAQTKRSLEFPMGVNYNPSKKETHHIPQCPPEKAAAIRAAMEHFQMII